MKNHNMVIPYSLLLSSLIFLSCAQKNQEDISGDSMDLGTISKSGIEINKVATLAILDSTEGQGQKVKFGDRVRMKVILMDKFEKQIGRSKLVTTRLGSGSAIAGIERAAVGMNVGGKRKVLVPSRLGYGPIGVRSMVAPHQDLIVAIDMLGIAGTKM